ncbi:MAG: hypothetical protein JW882_14360 [Deltaproteobacteria bacterium]|nr:hypothetical protein [Deltaproteobacteria bacterium]
MDIMTTDKKLLKQDDIDLLLNEAGLDGGYKPEKTAKPPLRVKNHSPVSFTNMKLSDSREALEILFKNTSLERDDNIKVIWNASGNISMATGMELNIQGTGYVTLGIFHKNHLMVKIV